MSFAVTQGNHYPAARGSQGVVHGVSLPLMENKAQGNGYGNRRVAIVEYTLIPDYWEISMFKFIGYRLITIDVNMNVSLQYMPPNPFMEKLNP